MKTLYAGLMRLFVLVILLLFLPAVAHAGFQEGKTAYDQKNWVKAITELRPLAEAGDDRALILLGNMYSEGLGVATDQTEALALYKRAAAEKNNAEAMVAIATFYISGIGVPKNMNLALQWFKRAADLGNQTGAFFCATILLRGNKSATDDIPSDVYAAYKWYKIAASEKQSPKMQKAAAALAKRVADQKLAVDQIARADQEAQAWKPVNAASLGPLPSIAAEK